MADNIVAGNETLATDEIGGVQFPRTKVGFGVDGAYTDVSADAPLPVTDADALAQLQAIVAALGAALTVQGTVALDASTLAALENITATISGTVTTTVTGNQVAPTDRSGTIAVGGASQVLMAANAARRGFWIQNVSNGDLWIDETGTAEGTQASMLLRPGALYESPVHGVPVSAISIYGATAGQAFSAREW